MNNNAGIDREEIDTNKRSGDAEAGKARMGDEIINERQFRAL